MLVTKNILQFVPRAFFLTFQCPFNKNSDKDIQQSQDAQGQLLSSDSFHSNAATWKEAADDSGKIN